MVVSRIINRRLQRDATVGGTLLIEYDSTDVSLRMKTWLRTLLPRTYMLLSSEARCVMEYKIENKKVVVSVLRNASSDKDNKEEKWVAMIIEEVPVKCDVLLDKKGCQTEEEGVRICKEMFEKQYPKEPWREC